MTSLSSSFESFTGEGLADLFLILGLFLGFCAFATLVIFVLISGGERTGSSFSGPRTLVPHANFEGGYNFDTFPLVASVLRERAEIVFADEIEVGFARFDDQYSVVYLQKPDELDDLTLITGLGEAHQAQLNKLGCFTYKQLANWSEDTCRIMSLELRTHDCLYREDWLGQARELHLRKYGEKI